MPEGVFYRYRNADGEVVVTDDPTTIPSAARDTVEALGTADLPPANVVSADSDLFTGGPAPVATARPVVRTARTEWLGPLHVPSAALGLLAAALPWVLSRFARGRLARVGLALAGATLAAGAWFGWVMRTAGFDAGPLAGPADVVREAAKAREALETSQRRQERALERLADP